MLVDSWYDPYLGVVILVRVIDGAIRKGQQIAFMAAGTTHLVDRVGVFRPKIEQFDRARRRRDRLHHRPDQGHHRDPRRRHDHRRPAAGRARRCPGFKLVQPVVFCGLFPADAADFEKLRDSHLQAPPQRRQLQLRDGDVGGARLRLPLRLPRPPPPRDHPGAADPRI